MSFLMNIYRYVSNLIHTTFDGVNEYVDLGTSDIIADGATSASWSFWINTTSSATQAIYSRYDGGSTATVPAIFVISGKISFYLGSNISNYRTSTASVNDGNWHHIVCNFNGSTNLDIYIDGVLSNGTLTGSIVSSLPTTSIANIIGGVAQLNGNWFNGYIDKAIFYNATLTSGEVTSKYNYGRFSGLIGIGNEVSQWELDTLNPSDEIGSNDGTSTNMDSSNIVIG